MIRKKFYVIAMLLSLPMFVFAGNFDVNSVNQPTQNQQIQPKDIVNNLINYLIWPLAVTGVIICFILAGFSFITAHGEPAKLDTARKYLIGGIIGVIVILIGFSIITTVQWLTGIT